MISNPADSKGGVVSAARRPHVEDRRWKLVGRYQVVKFSCSTREIPEGKLKASMCRLSLPSLLVCLLGHKWQLR